MSTSHTVWLASYPRSGNTWTRPVLAALSGERARAGVDINELADGPIASSRAALDLCLGFASSDLLPAETAALRPACDAEFDIGLTGMRLRKIHDGLFTGPAGSPIVPPDFTRAAIYLVRDPRDVAVSFAHFANRPLHRAVDAMSDPGSGISRGERALYAQMPQHLGTWSEHVTGWTGHDLFPVAVFRYEDLLADPVGEFARMTAFAGLTVGRAEVADAVEAARFERLRSLESRHGFHERPATTTRFFRRGVAGGWRDELPAGLARRIEAEHAEVMARYRYTVDAGPDLPAAPAGRLSTG